MPSSLDLRGPERLDPQAVDAERGGSRREILGRELVRRRVREIAGGVDPARDSGCALGDASDALVSDEDDALDLATAIARLPASGTVRAVRDALDRGACLLVRRDVQRGVDHPAQRAAEARRGPRDGCRCRADRVRVGGGADARRSDAGRGELPVEVQDERRAGLSAELAGPLEPRPDPFVEARDVRRLRNGDAEDVDVDVPGVFRAHLHVHRGSGCYRVVRS